MIISPAMFEEFWVERPWGAIPYEQALALQKDRASTGGRGWVLFSPRPVVTLGRRAGAEDVVVPTAALKARGVQELRVDRGGLATFHGPGQIVGFPVGTLSSFVGDPTGVRIFVRALEERLARVVRKNVFDPEIHVRVSSETKRDATAGIWLDRRGELRKIVSIGIRFSRSGIAHGFALNVFDLQESFSWIRVCGVPGEQVGSLMSRPWAGTESDHAECDRVALDLRAELASIDRSV